MNKQNKFFERSRAVAATQKVSVSGNMLTGILFSIILAILMMLTSCSKDEDVDLSDLMTTVPSDVSMVAAFDTKILLEKGGCKVKDNNIDAGEDMLAAVKAIKDPQTKALVEGLLSGKSGVETGATIVFMEGFTTYCTGMIAEPDKFKSFAEKYTEEKFSSSDGVDVCGNVAMKGGQYWINLTTATEINVNEIRRFAALNENQSFLSTPCGGDFRVLDHDLKGWAVYNVILSHYELGFSNAAIIRMAMNAAFEDLQYVSLNLDFKKGEAEMDIRPLNSDNKPAKFLLPMEKISDKAFASAGGSAGMVFALGANKKLVSKLLDLGKSFGGSVAESYAQIAKSIDGTIVVAGGKEGSMNAVVTTTGEGAGPLADFLGTFGAVSRDGKMVVMKKGEVGGSLDVAKCGSELKGALAGLIVSGEYEKKEMNDPVKPQLNQTKVEVKSDGGSIRIDVEVKAVDEKSNFLLTAIRSIKN